MLNFFFSPSKESKPRLTSNAIRCARHWVPGATRLKWDWFRGYFGAASRNRGWLEAALAVGRKSLARGTA